MKLEVLLKDIYLELLKEEYICVLGNESKIKEQSGLFNKLVKVIK